MTVEERRKAGKVFVNLWGKVVGVQGAKPHARSMTQIPKRKQNETIKRSQIQKIRATLVRQHGGTIRVR